MFKLVRKSEERTQYKGLPSNFTLISIHISSASSLLFSAWLLPPQLLRPCPHLRPLLDWFTLAWWLHLASGDLPSSADPIWLPLVPMWWAWCPAPSRTRPSPRCILRRCWSRASMVDPFGSVNLHETRIATRISHPHASHSNSCSAPAHLGNHTSCLPQCPVYKASKSSNENEKHTKKMFRH